MNTHRKTANIWLAVSLVALAAAILPFFDVVDLDEGGGAMILLGMTLFFTGLSVHRMHRRMTDLWDLLDSGKTAVIARWVYEPEEWLECVNLQYHETKNANRGTLVIVSVVSLIIGIPIGLVSENLPAVFGGLALLLAIIVPIALLTPGATRKSMLAAEPRAILGATGVLYANRIHLLKGWGHHFEGIEHVDGVLRISYSSRNGRSGRQMHMLVLKVPARAMAEIEDVLNAYSNLV